MPSRRDFGPATSSYQQVNTTVGRPSTSAVRPQVPSRMGSFGFKPKFNMGPSSKAQSRMQMFLKSKGKV